MPENIAKLKVITRTEVSNSDGTYNYTETELETVDCRFLYPELIKDDTPVGGPESFIHCIDPRGA